MAQNRESDHEPTHSSSEEEESSSEEAPESESEEVPPTPPVTKKPSTSETINTASSSSDESDSGSGFESDSPLKKSAKVNPTIKPIASKPMDETLKTIKKTRSKPNLPTSSPTAKSSPGAKRPMSESETRDSKRAMKKATDADNGDDGAKSSTGAKRPLPESETKDSKRAKKKATDADNGADGAKMTKMTNEDDQKKQLFQRLWSEDDEIVILKGIIDYTEKKGLDPFADMNAFYNFINKSLNVNVSKAQLLDKVRRLKKKYVNNAKKEKNGKERTFSKTHEQKGYELSKKIWGNNSAIDSTKVNGTAIKNQSPRKSEEAPLQKVNGLDVQKEVSTMKPEENVGLSLLGGSGFAEKIIKGRLELIVGHKRTELEEKWKKQRVEEVALYLKRVELIKEQTELVLEDLKSSEK